MSLEASAINASSTTATGIALLSKSDESNSLVADDSENPVSVTTSASEMNVAFWDSSLKGLTDSSSRLPESSVVSGTSSELASCAGSEASGERGVAGDNLAVDLTEQGMLHTSFTETEPSDKARGHADETAVDGTETENADLSQVSSETAADNPGEQSAAATEAAQVEDSASGGLMAKSSSSASIYLDDGTAERRQPSKKANPPKRLTMVSILVHCLRCTGTCTCAYVHVHVPVICTCTCTCTS